MGNYKERHDLPGISVAGTGVVGTASLVVVGVVVSIMLVAWGLKTPSPVQQRHNLKIYQNLHVPVK